MGRGRKEANFDLYNKFREIFLMVSQHPDDIAIADALTYLKCANGSGAEQDGMAVPLVL